MTSGFWTGAAQGIQKAQDQALEAKKESDLQDYRNQKLGDSAAGDATTKARAAVDGIFSVLTKTATSMSQAGHSPDETANAVKPLLQHALDLAPFAGTGYSAPLLIDKARTIVGTPAAPTSEVGKLKADLHSGAISPDEYTDRLQRITTPVEGVPELEQVRRKIGAGQPLSPGETQLYNDSISGDPLLKRMFGSLANGGGLGGGLPALPGAAAPAAPTPAPQVPGQAAAAAPIAPRTFNGASDYNAALQAKQINPGDRVIVGGVPGTVH